MEKFIINTGLKLSSLEIAELTQKDHKNVTRDIDEMIKALNINPLSFEQVEILGNNQTRRFFNLPPREVKILITGYSVPLRAKVIDRLEELEKAQKPRAMSSLDLFRESVEALIEEREQRKLLEVEHKKLAVDHVKLEEKVDHAIEDSILSSIEQGRLQSAIESKAEQWGDVKYNGYIKKALKEKFFGTSASKQRTFKEIPRKHYSTALSFVSQWTPHQRFGVY